MVALPSSAADEVRGRQEDDQVVVIPDGDPSRKQVAELFRVDPQTLSQWVQAGQLEGSLYEGRWCSW